MFSTSDNNNHFPDDWLSDSCIYIRLNESCAFYACSSRLTLLNKEQQIKKENKLEQKKEEEENSKDRIERAKDVLFLDFFLLFFLVPSISQGSDDEYLLYSYCHHPRRRRCSARQM